MNTLTRTVALSMLAALLFASQAPAGVAPEEFGDTVIDLVGYLGNEVTVRDGEYAFGFEPYAGTALTVFKTINSNIYPLTTITIAAEPEQMTVSGDYVYILHAQDGGDYPSLSVIEVVDPAAPVIVYHEQLLVGETNSENYNGLAVADGFLWLAIDGFPYVYDVSYPWNPVYRGRGAYFSEFQGNATERLTIKDEYVYICSRWITSPGHFKPSLVSYRVDPDDNVQNYGYYQPVAESVLDFEDEILRTIVSGDLPELFASVADPIEPRKNSGILRLHCNVNGTVSTVTSLHAADEYTYACWRLEVEGNYLYAQASEVLAIDISDPGAMSVVGNCGALDGNMAVFSAYVAGGSKATPRINDQPVAASTGIRAWNAPNPALPGHYLWNFQWYTDTWTDPVFDQVVVTTSTGGCGVNLPLYVRGSTCEFDAGTGLFRHQLSEPVLECFQGCSFSWAGLSVRTGLPAYVQGTLRIKTCPSNAPKSATDVSALGTILEAPTPNPFNPQTTIRFHIPAGARTAELTVLDVSGRVIRRLAAETGVEGWQEAVWTGDDDTGRRVASGLYFARLITDLGAGEVQKLMLMK